MLHHGAMVVGMGKRSCADAAVAKRRAAERVKETKARNRRRRIREARLREPIVLTEEDRRVVAEMELKLAALAPLDTDAATQ